MGIQTIYLDASGLQLQTSTGLQVVKLEDGATLTDGHIDISYLTNLTSIRATFKLKATSPSLPDPDPNSGATGLNGEFTEKDVLRSFLVAMNTGVTPSGTIMPLPVVPTINGNWLAVSSTELRMVIDNTQIAEYEITVTWSTNVLNTIWQVNWTTTAETVNVWQPKEIKTAVAYGDFVIPTGQGIGQESTALIGLNSGGAPRGFDTYIGIGTYTLTCSFPILSSRQLEVSAIAKQISDNIGKVASADIFGVTANTMRLAPGSGIQGPDQNKTYTFTLQFDVRPSETIKDDKGVNHVKDPHDIVDLMTFAYQTDITLSDGSKLWTNEIAMMRIMRLFDTFNFNNIIDAIEALQETPTSTPTP